MCNTIQYCTYCTVLYSTVHNCAVLYCTKVSSETMQSYLLSRVSSHLIFRLTLPWHYSHLPLIAPTYNIQPAYSDMFDFTTRSIAVSIIFKTVQKQKIFPKRDGGSTILNSWSKKASAVFLAYNETIGVSLQQWLSMIFIRLWL